MTGDADICSCPGCKQKAIVYCYPVWKRRVRYPAQYCAEHTEVFLRHYRAAGLIGEGSPQRRGEAVNFDVELLLLDQRRERPCQLSLREVGGGRRLDCEIGLFEGVALQRELEQLPAPRPLTHRAMASLVTALGWQLDFVLVDKLRVVERIYEAKLHVYHPEARSEVLVDVRVSDAAVIAVICGAPIFISEEVLTRLTEMEQP